MNLDWDDWVYILLFIIYVLYRFYEKSRPKVRHSMQEAQQNIQNFVKSEAHVRRNPHEILQEFQSYLHTQKEQAATHSVQKAARKAEKFKVRGEKQMLHPAAPVQQETCRTRERKLLPSLTPENMQQAIVLAEVLGKPKALRRRKDK